MTDSIKLRKLLAWNGDYNSIDQIKMIILKAS